MPDWPPLLWHPPIQGRRNDCLSRFLARHCRDDWTILLQIRADYAVVVGPRRPICIIALATQRGLGRHDGIAVLDMANTSHDAL